MVIAELSRLFGGSIGSVVAGFAGPKLLVVAAVGFLSMWGYNKFTSQQLETVKAEQVATQLESDKVKQLNQMLSRAMESISTYEKERTARDVSNRATVRVVETTADSTLDVGVPATVVRLLRQPLGFHSGQGAVTTSGSRVGVVGPSRNELIGYANTNVP